MAASRAAIVVLAVLSVILVGCNKEEEVGYGGEVKKAPGATAVPAGKPVNMPQPSLD